MSKRGNGEGSVFRAKNGSWVGKLTIGHQTDAQGRRQPIRRRVTGDTRREVVAQMDALRAAVAMGTLPTSGDVTIEAFLRWWVCTALPSRVERGSLAPTTFDQYRNVVECYIVGRRFDPSRPPLRRRLAPLAVSGRLSDLRPRDIHEMVDRLLAAGLSTRTAALAQTVLGIALSDAVEEDVLVRNVAHQARGPRTVTRAKRTLRPEQAQRLLTACVDDRLGPLWALLLLCGLRSGEALGLEWSDIDADQRTLRVRQTLKRVEGKGLSLGETKTKGSRRTIALPNLAVDVLAAHRRRQNEERLLCGPGWEPWPLSADLVFRTAIGTPTDPDNARQAFYKLSLAALGERWSPHELRHSNASLLFAAGQDLELVAGTLGHSSSRVTREIYLHLLDEGRRSVADAVDAAFA